MSEFPLQSIVESLDSADEAVRMQAVRRLAGLGTAEAVALLKGRGGADPSAAIRHFVRKALKILEMDGEEEAGAMAPASPSTTRPMGSGAPLSRPMPVSAPSASSAGLPVDAFEEPAGPGGPAGPNPPEEIPALSMRELERLQRTANRILTPCIQLLIESLEHHDLSVASEAAAALGKLRAREATDRLLDLLRAGSADENVAFALGEMGDERALQPLMRTFRESVQPGLKQAVVTAVARLRNAAGDDFLRSALDHPDPVVQQSVIRVIGETGNTAFIDVLLDRLGHVDEYLESAIIQTLGKMAPGHPRVIVRFTALLKSEVNPRKVAGLVTALARTRDPRLVDTLEGFTAHRDRRVRANAVEALAELEVGDPVKLRILRPMLQDADNRVRANGCIVLGRLGERRALDTLLAMLSDPNKWYRASACYAIGALKPPDGATFLIKGLRDADPTVRVNAAKALRELGDPNSAATLIASVGDRNPWIRLYAIEALGRMQLHSAHARLKACLKQETNQQVLASALLAVARTGGSEESTRILVDYLKHEDSRVRANAIEALEYIFTRESVVHITACLRDQDHRVRANAVKAIWKFGELRVVTTLHGMLSSPRPEERKSGAYALGEIGIVQAQLASLPNVGRLVRALQTHPSYAAA